MLSLPSAGVAGAGRQDSHHLRPALLAPGDAQTAVEQLDPLAHAAQAEAAALASRLEALAVVADAYPHGALAASELHDYERGLCVPRRVREALLDDPVGGGVDLRGRPAMRGRQLEARIHAQAVDRLGSL